MKPEVTQSEFKTKGPPILGKPLNRMDYGDRRIADFGLPQRMPIPGGLPCGCSEALFCAAGELVDGIIEADYCCQYNLHNYFVFSLQSDHKDGETKLEVAFDRFGGEGIQGHKVEELDEY